jgi:hypothetical protein
MQIARQRCCCQGQQLLVGWRVCLQQHELRMVLVLLQQLTIQVKPSFAEMILVNDPLQHKQASRAGCMQATVDRDSTGQPTRCMVCLRCGHTHAAAAEIPDVRMKG